MDLLIIITSLLTGLFIIIKVRSMIKKSNQRKRERERREKERELISSVTPLNRGTETERLLILELLENDTPPITIYHDLIIKKPNDKFSQIDLVLVMTEGIIVFEVKDYSGWLYGSGNSFVLVNISFSFPIILLLTFFIFFHHLIHIINDYTNPY